MLINHMANEQAGKAVRKVLKLSGRMVSIDLIKDIHKYRVGCYFDDTTNGRPARIITVSAATSTEAEDKVWNIVGNTYSLIDVIDVID